MLVIKTPINAMCRHEFARNVDPQDLELPWTTLQELLKDKDFVTISITTMKDNYVITKDSSW